VTNYILEYKHKYPSCTGSPELAKNNWRYFEILYKN